MSTRLWLYRHGEADKNLDPTIVGGQNKNSPLTTDGWQQATSLANVLSKRKRPRFSAIYTSGCTRAIQTGWKIQATLPYQAELFKLEELNELSQGIFEGQPRTTPGFIELIDRLPDVKMLGGQSVVEVGTNVRYALTMIAENHPNQDVAVVGHAVATRCFLANLEAYDYHTTRRVLQLPIPRCSETEIVYDEGIFTVNAIGRTLF